MDVKDLGGQVLSVGDAVYIETHATSLRTIDAAGVVCSSAALLNEFALVDCVGTVVEIDVLVGSDTVVRVAFKGTTDTVVGQFRPKDLSQTVIGELTDECAIDGIIEEIAERRDTVDAISSRRQSVAVGRQPYHAIIEQLTIEAYKAAIAQNNTKYIFRDMVDLIPEVIDTIDHYKHALDITG